MSEAADTRQQFLSVATRLFAERGFYGTSIAAIADELPYTKQALLHHFGSKEKLYGEVLKGISDQLMAELEAARDATSGEGSSALEDTLIRFYRLLEGQAYKTQLLMRELLDNKHRATSANVWYLRPFLESLIALAKQASPSTFSSDAQALISVYQLLGAMNYFLVSEPTLSQMFGEEMYRELRSGYEEKLRVLISQAIG